MGNSRPGLWRKDPALSEGKYPVVLRRDGTIPEWEWFILGSKDPAAPAALRAYASEAFRCGMDAQYVEDMRALADTFEIERHLREEAGERKGDPDKGPHRRDDELTLRLARHAITMADLARLEQEAAFNRKNWNLSQAALREENERMLEAQRRESLAAAQLQRFRDAADKAEAERDAAVKRADDAERVADQNHRLLGIACDDREAARIKHNDEKKRADRLTAALSVAEKALKTAADALRRGYALYEATGSDLYGALADAWEAQREAANECDKVVAQIEEAKRG